MHIERVTVLIRIKIWVVVVVVVAVAVYQPRLGAISQSLRDNLTRGPDNELFQWFRNSGKGGLDKVSCNEVKLCEYYA